MKRVLLALSIILFGFLIIPNVKADEKEMVKVYLFKVDGCGDCEEQIELLKSIPEYNVKFQLIIKDETANQAIMFLPAEAIFAELNAYYSDLIEYAYKKRVWITSPTTLMSTLTVVQMIVKNIERDKYTSIIHEELNKLGIEFDRYKYRWDRLAKSIQTVNKEVEDVQITSDKISKKFSMISGVELEKITLEGEKE